MKLASYQGDLDGLCGVYAVTHALNVACGVDEYPINEKNKKDTARQRIFRAACHAIKKKDWPDVVVDGTDFGQLKSIINKTIKPIKHIGIEVVFPFADKTRAPTADVFWAWMKNEWQNREGEVRCAIIGISAPFQHWTVIGLNGGRVVTLDSDFKNPMVQKNISSLGVKKIKETGNKWSIDVMYTAVFYRTV